MNYDAVAVGPQDLSAGIEFLFTRSPQNFPWVSANILNEEKETVFQPYIMKSAGTSNIAIIGLTGITALKKPYLLTDWQEVLPPLIEKLTQKSDFLIILSTLTNEENEEIANTFPQVRVIITGNPRQRNQKPQLMNNALLTQTTRQGKYVGYITCNLGNSGTWGEDPQLKLSLLNAKKDALQKRLGKLEKDSTLEPVTKSEALDRTNKQITTLSKTISGFKEKMALQERNKQVDATYTFKFLAMSKTHPEVKEINEILTNLKKSIQDFNKNQKRKTTANINEASPLIAGLEGHVSCVECHESQTLFWQSTQHSHAYSTLLKKGQAFNLDCLPCHVTYNEKTLSKTPENLPQLLSLRPSLLSVGCEYCHGPSREHVKNPENVKPVRNLGKETCLVCHTQERDDNFIYEEKLMKISCPSE